MDIYWYGQSCFKIKGKTSSIVIDPFTPDVIGLKLPKDLEADVVLQTHNHPDHNNISAVKSDISTPIGRPVFDAPGEYEIKGAIITGVKAFHDSTNGEDRGMNTIFHIYIDGLNIVHLGDLGQNKLTEEQIQAIAQTDILMVPVGGNYTINSQEAAQIISQLEPKIIIPMHYAVPGLKVELEGNDKFLKEMGVEEVTEVPKLTITKDKLPDEPQVIVLKIS